MKCEASAVVLHYWVTAGVCWMLAEGAHLYQTVHHVLSPTRFMPAYWSVHLYLSIEDRDRGKKRSGVIKMGMTLYTRNKYGIDIRKKQ